MKCEVELRNNLNRIFRPGELMQGAIKLKSQSEIVINGECN